MINEIDVDGSGFLEFQEFCLMLYKRTQDADVENDLKETFRVFSKDDEGCITAEELKFVLTHLPGKVTPEAVISLLGIPEVAKKSFWDFVQNSGP